MISPYIPNCKKNCNLSPSDNFTILRLQQKCHSTTIMPSAYLITLLSSDNIISFYLQIVISHLKPRRQNQDIRHPDSHSGFILRNYKTFLKNSSYSSLNFPLATNSKFPIIPSSPPYPYLHRYHYYHPSYPKTSPKRRNSELCRQSDIHLTSRQIIRHCILNIIHIRHPIIAADVRNIKQVEKIGPNCDTLEVSPKII